MSRAAVIALLLLISTYGFAAPALRGSENADTEHSGLDEAMNVLMEESILADNSDEIIRRANGVADEQRYEILRNWVLPSNIHNSLRLTASFCAASETRDQVNSTDNLKSPALKLVMLATQLGRLSELRQQIIDCEVSSETQMRSRLALLSLVDMADKNFPEAMNSVSNLFDRHRQQVFPDMQDRWPETLVATVAIGHKELREPTEEILQRMLREQARVGRNNGPDPWDRLMVSLVGQLSLSKETSAETPEFGGRPNLQEWYPVSSVDFGTRGLGFPQAHWEYDGKSVAARSHHQNDFLYYRTPLNGNYEVECDLSGFDYRDSQLMVAGMWIGPAFNHEEYLIGDVRSQLPNGKINPRLSEISDWIRIRAVVRDQQCSFFIDGRPIHVEPRREVYDPWLAIRVPFYAFGQVRDVCITGEPTVPDSVNLSASSQLAGWTSYYGGDFGRPNDSDWWHESDASGHGMIVGRNDKSRAGTAKESLLQYQRPVIEDGVIEYDFYYEPGKSNVHPAVGRHVMLLNADGLKTHQITDAHFGRTDADPLNQESPATTATLSSLSLAAGEWNHARLTFKGDVLELSINELSVYRSNLPVQSDRTFGLFHYDGETEIRVRNVMWHGDWPKVLRDLRDQELRDKTSYELDAALPQLIAVFKHDFSKDGLPLTLFQIQDQDAQKFTEVKSDGLHIHAEMDGEGYKRVCITPLMIVEGDFDMTAEFADLTISPTRHGRCDAILQMAFTDEPISHHAAAMSKIIDPGRFPQCVVEHQFLQLKPFHMDFLDKRSEEITSGTLRLARRNDKVYSLLAPEGSKHFRLIHMSDSAMQPSRFDGARLVAGMNSSIDGISKVSVVWKSLVVRAERLTGPAIDVLQGSKRPSR